MLDMFADVVTRRELVAVATRDRHAPSRLCQARGQPLDERECRRPADRGDEGNSQTGDGVAGMNKISIMPPCIWDRTKPTAWMNGVDSVFAIYCHRCGARTPPKTTLAEAQDVWRDMMDGTRTELLAALENLIANAQPDNWDDDDDPDQAEAWRAAFRALCKAKGLPVDAK